MTVYARGYRDYKEGFEARRFRFAPITRQGTSQAMRGVAFWVLIALILVVLLIFTLMLYLQSGDLARVFGTMQGEENLSDAALAQRNLEAALIAFHGRAGWLVILLVLFTSAGTIADDLKSRALPLYLVRPLTPFDYYLGKLLVPIQVLALAVLVPGLFLVLFAALMRPTGESLSFLLDQGRTLGALLLHFAVLSVSYASIVLMYSASTSRRITAAILGTVTFMGGGLLRAAVWRLHGTVVDGLRALSLGADTDAILYRALGRRPARLEVGPPLPDITAAAIVLAGVSLLAAWVVLRRARSVEIVS